MGRRVDEGHRDRCHADGLALARAGEDDIFHSRAAKTFCRLLSQNPGDCIAEIRFSAAVRADYGGNACPMEPHFGSVAERLKSLQFYSLEPKHGGLTTSLTLENVATLLHYAYGVTRNNKGTAGRPFRVVPSGGALYLLEIFFYSAYIEGLQTGLYHYNPVHHHLRLLHAGDETQRLVATVVPGHFILCRRRSSSSLRRSSNGRVSNTGERGLSLRPARSRPCRAEP